MSGMSDSRRGTVLGIVSYLIWGFAALYWIETRPVSAIDVLAHRALWSLPVAVLLLLVVRRLRAALGHLLKPRTMAFMGLAAICIAVNWGVFVWSVTNGRATEASLGYFLLPLVNVVIGLAFFGESLDRAQKIGVFFAAAAIGLQIVHLGGLPLVSLSVALSFGLYGAIRKGVSVESLEGLFLETLFLFPVALIWLWSRDWGGLGAHGLPVDLFLLGSGLFTAIPLITYVAASRLLPLSALGLVFYIGPSAQFLVARFMLGEPFDVVRFVSFALVWIGLAFVTVDALRRTRRQPPVRTDAAA